jgi:AcrR family transcriptional regulator
MSPRERILVAARACFAAKGFAGTTIADIEGAAGYTPRSGGVYRHFRSKVEILEAVIDAELADNAKAIHDVPDPAYDGSLDPVDVLEEAARRGLAQLDRQAELTKIVFRDLDQFDELLTKVRDGLIDATYRDFVARLEAAGIPAARPDLDPEAIAVLAIGPIVDFKVKQHLLGAPPLGLEEDRLVHAWAHLFATVFGVAR